MKKQDIKSVTKGVAIAVAAAGLLSGCQSMNPASAEKKVSSAGASTDLVHCSGVNACGGHNDCKTASNACAGHASCKGKGFVAMPSKACDDVGGTVSDSYKGSVAKADLIHCNGVNKCGGHNDCKTASNACAGHASCKGMGFVSMPAKACGDIGGKQG
ncbi:MAG: hypothetical protein V3V12_08360 [Gammaproteobacteria bacterium]